MILKRFLVLAVLGIILSFSLLTYLVAHEESNLLKRNDKEKLWLVTQSLTAALKSSMLQGEPVILRNVVDRLNREGPLKVAVYGPDGSLALGEGDISIPRDVLAAPKEIEVHDGASAAFLHPLLNEPACNRCHSSELRTLGVVSIEMPQAVLAGGVNDIGPRMVFFGILLVFSASAAAFLVAKKSLLDPISEIHKGVELIKGGDLGHRISLRKNDELGSLAAAFDDMAEKIEKSHYHLEKAVKQKTRELRAIAELSTEVFKGSISFDGTIDRFLAAITEQMDFGYSSLCLVDRKTGMLSREFRRGLAEGFCASGISLASDHPFVAAIREAKPSVNKSSDIEMPAGFIYAVIVPILSHQRRRCKEINACTFQTCPAFAGVDDRCWLIEGTLCRSPHAVAGKEKIFGCLHCDAFPVLGVLVAGRDGEISKSSLHSLEILASQISSAVENRRFIEEKKEDISRLIKLHDISVETLQNLEDSLPVAIVSSAALFSGMEGAILWRSGKEGRLYVEESFNIEKDLIPHSVQIDGSFAGKALIEGRPVETVEMRNVSCMGDVIARHAFLYAATLPLRFKDKVYGCLTLFHKRDSIMTDSEKAAILLFASQAAAALNTVRLYQELRAEKEFSEAIFNNTASGIMVVDREGCLMKLNRTGGEILQTDEAELKGKRIIEMYPETKAMLAKSTGISDEIMLTLPDKTVIPLGFNKSALIDMPTGRQGTVIVFRDLSQVRKLQAELRKKEHFKTMEKVVSGVAHEVRNPLFGISSIAQILDRELDSPQHKALLKAMLRETDRMKRLIEELLLYTRPARMNIKEFDLAMLMQELTYYAKAKREEVDLSVQMPSLLSVKADRDKITQVLLNLLNNAVDAATKAISVTAEAADGAIQIRVADDGTGISPEDLDRVFDPFFTTKRGGTGLGLPICRKIIEDHGGRIEVNSSPSGTEVTVHLNP